MLQPDTTLCESSHVLGGWSGGYSFPVTHRDAPQVLPLTALCTETPSKHNKMSQTRGRGLTNQFCFLYSFLSSAYTGTHHAKSWIVSHLFQMKVRISNFTCFNLTTQPFSSLDENPIAHGGLLIFFIHSFSSFCSNRITHLDTMFPSSSGM